MHLGQASCYGGQNHFLGRREISEYQIERIQAGNAHCTVGANETAARAD
jgi:hypothetical protein